MEAEQILPDGPFEGWTHRDVEKLMFTLALGATVFVAFLLYGTIRFIEWYNAEPVLQYSIAELKAPEEKDLAESEHQGLRNVRYSMLCSGDGTIFRICYSFHERRY